MSTLEVRAVTPEKAAAFIRTPEIWSRSAGDISPRAFALPPRITAIGGYVGGELVGLGLAYPHEDGQKLHYQVLRAYRLRHARRLLQAILERLTGPIYVSIPLCYPEVANFARKAGFVSRGTEPGSYWKDGVRYDKEVLVR